MASSPIVPPTIYPDHQPVFYLYSIRAHRRDALKSFLASKEIATAVHYPVPAYRQECIQKMASQTVCCPVTEEICREILAIPLYPEMNETQQVYVVESIKEFYESQR